MPLSDPIADPPAKLAKKALGAFGLWVYLATS